MIADGSIKYFITESLRILLNDRRVKEYVFVLITIGMLNLDVGRSIGNCDSFQNGTFKNSATRLSARAKIRH